MTTLFSAVDRDGDNIKLVADEDDDADMAIVVRQDHRNAAVCLDEQQLDELIEALCEFRGREVPEVVTNYDRRLAAMQAAKPLVQNLFSGATPEHLITVAHYLLHGIPEMEA